MDIQDQLSDVNEALKRHQISHARRLLRDIDEISNDRFVDSMVESAISDINYGRFISADQDIHTAQVLDERNNYTVQF